MLGATLTCLISHPELDPKTVSDELNMTPIGAHRKGEQILTPEGQETGDTYKVGKWAFRIELAGIDDLERALTELIGRLYPSKHFIRDITKSGGRVVVFFNLPNPTPLAFQVSPDTLKKISEMGGHFGFEVFA
jgi:hypothetical protein